MQHLKICFSSNIHLLIRLLMNLKTPIIFSGTGKVKDAMNESQGNKMDARALAYLERPNFTINQQLTHQNF